MLSKAIYKLKVNLIKVPMAFYTETEKKNTKICMKLQNTPNSQSILGKKRTKLELSSSIPDLKTYCRATVTKAA
jgi:hypothetical protein